MFKWEICIQKYKEGKYFTQDIYIQENLTLFMGITSHFKQSNDLRSTLCIWEPPIQGTVYVYDREWCMNMEVFNVHMHAHVLFHNVCISSFVHTNTGGSSVSEMDLEDDDVILVCGIVLYFLI
jgi:hypothetical protein